MALVLGTNSGFVTVAPTGDPGGIATTRDNYAWGMKVVSAADATLITEVGWWSDNYSEEANFEVGLYSHDAGNDKPGTRLFVDATNAKGTAAGWKTVAVSWSISVSTTYWITCQIDNTSTATKMDYKTTTGTREVFTSAATLPEAWPAFVGNDNYLNSIYAVYNTPIYSELAGTIASTSNVSGNMDTTAISTLAGTIAATSSVSGSLGSTSVGIDVQTSFTKRLVVAGNNNIYYESI